MKNRKFSAFGILFISLSVSSIFILKDKDTFLIYKTDILEPLKSTVGIATATPEYTLGDPINVKLNPNYHSSSSPTLNLGDIVYFTAEMMGNLPADGAIKRTMHVNFSRTKGVEENDENNYITTSKGNKVVTSTHYTDLMKADTTYYFCVQFGMNPDNSPASYSLNPNLTFSHNAKLVTKCVWSDDSITFPKAPPNPTACDAGKTCLYSEGKNKCAVAPSVMCKNEDATGFTCEIDGYVCPPYCEVGSTCAWNAICKNAGTSCSNFDGTTTCYPAKHVCEYCEIGSVCTSNAVCNNFGHRCSNFDGTQTCYAPGTPCPPKKKPDAEDEVVDKTGTTSETRAENTPRVGTEPVVNTIARTAAESTDEFKANVEKQKNDTGVKHVYENTPLITVRTAARGLMSILAKVVNAALR